MKEPYTAQSSFFLSMAGSRELEEDNTAKQIKETGMQRFKMYKRNNIVTITT